MFSSDFVHDFRVHWLPQISTPGLKRLIQLISTNSPKLIQGAFTDDSGAGCLATHAAWTHPALKGKYKTGIDWLRIAGNSPAVIDEWDALLTEDLATGSYREHLLALLQEELHKRETSGTSLQDELIGRAGILIPVVHNAPEQLPYTVAVEEALAGEDEAEAPDSVRKRIGELLTALKATLGAFFLRLFAFTREKFQALGERFEAFLDGPDATAATAAPETKAIEQRPNSTPELLVKQIPTVTPAVAPLMCPGATRRQEQPLR